MNQALPNWQDRPLRAQLARGIATQNILGEGKYAIDLQFVQLKDCARVLEYLGALFPNMEVTHEGAVLNISYTLKDQNIGEITDFWTRYKDCFHATFRVNRKKVESEAIPPQFNYDPKTKSFPSEAEEKAYFEWLFTEEGKKLAPHCGEVRQQCLEAQTALMEIQESLSASQVMP
jgi:hypothetical protein